MTRRSRFAAPGLVWRQLASDRSASVLLAVLVALAVLVVALLPRTLAALAQDELHQELTSVSPVRIDVSALGQLGYLVARGDTTADDVYGELDDALKRIPSVLGPPLSDALGTPEWVARLPQRDVDIVEPKVGKTSLTVALGPRWEQRVRFVAGSAPARWVGGGAPDPSATPPIDIALSADSAAQMGLTVGDVLGYPIAALRISGLYEPADAEDPYWAHVGQFLHPTVTRGPQGPDTIAASAYINTLSALDLPDELVDAQIQVWYPTLPDKLDYTDTGALLDQARQLAAIGASLPTGESLEFQTTLFDAISRVDQRVTSVTALLALSGSGPLGVVIAVLALGVRSVIGRRKDALALASARGASSGQLRGVMLIEGLLIAVPVSVLAVVVATLAVPAQVGPESLVLPIAIAAAVPVLFGATTPARGLRTSRGDLAAGSRSTARWTAEVVVIGLAALALYLLARRGLLDSSARVGVDPLLAATPLLLSLAACVLVLRLYPLPLLALQRRLRRARGAVGMIGSARAVRDPTAGFASVLAMVAGVSAALFSLVMATTLGAGLVSTAQQEVGADIRVAALQLPPDLVAQVVGMPGIVESAALAIAPDVTMAAGNSELHAGVVFVDAAALHAVRPDLPELEVGTDDEVRYLASSGVSERIADGDSSLDTVVATSSGTIDDEALPGLGGTWVIVDASQQLRILGDELLPSQLLLTTAPGVDTGALATRIRDLVLAGQTGDDAARVSVTDVATNLAMAQARPSTRALSPALLIAAALSLVLSALAIIVGSVGATGARNRILGVLRMLGMSPRQARGLVAWELAPVAITAVVGGTALGLVLPYIVTSVLDLRAFVGGSARIAPVIPVWLVAAVALGFAAIALSSGLIAIAVARRTNPAQTVKMGSA